MKMEHVHLLPRPIGCLLSLLPTYPGSALFAAGLNVALSRHLPGDLCEALTGKTLRLGVMDAQLQFDFRWSNGHFLPCSPSKSADLTISACMHDFILLARRQTDPDTLFFSRRLEIAGDTELGLRVKNALDALDIAPLGLSSFVPSNIISRFKQ